MMFHSVVVYKFSERKCTLWQPPELIECGKPLRGEQCSTEQTDPIEVNCVVLFGGNLLANKCKFIYNSFELCTIEYITVSSSAVQ